MFGKHFLPMTSTKAKNITLPITTGWELKIVREWLKKENCNYLYHPNSFVMNTNIFIPLRAFGSLINKMAAFVLLILFNSACNSHGPENVVPPDSSKLTTVAWTVNFPAESTDIVRELSMYSIERVLLDSVNAVKNNMKDLKVSLNRIQFPTGNNLNYQIRMEIAGDDGYFKSHPIILGDSIPFHILSSKSGGPVPPRMPNLNMNTLIATARDTIIIRQAFVLANKTSCLDPTNCP
jgi:hypothetical protein